MLMTHGEITAGEQLFARVEKNTITYNAMMSLGYHDSLHCCTRRFFLLGYLTNERAQQAIDIFFQIDKPMPISYMLLFNVCARLVTPEALNVGRRVYSRLPVEMTRKNSPNRVLNAALDMFIKCDQLQQAELLFSQLKRDIVCYGSMMQLYNQHNEPRNTLSLFEQMKLERIEPNAIIVVVLLNACTQLGDLITCESIVAQVPKAFLSNLWIQNALIDMWVRNERSEFIGGEHFRTS